MFLFTFLLALMTTSPHAAPVHTTSIVASAEALKGQPYVWGGTGSAGFDCSGFVYHVYGSHGIHLARMADEQYHEGTPEADPKPGDLVFFKTYLPGPSHVGIYLGHGRFIHASSAKGKVVESQLNTGYYHDRYLGARRFTP